MFSTYSWMPQCCLLIQLFSTGLKFSKSAILANYRKYIPWMKPCFVMVLLSLDLAPMSACCFRYSLNNSLFGALMLMYFSLFRECSRFRLGQQLWHSSSLVYRLSYWCIQILDLWCKLPCILFAFTSTAISLYQQFIIRDDWKGVHVYGMDIVFSTELALNDLPYSLVTLGCFPYFTEIPM